MNQLNKQEAHNPNILQELHNMRIQDVQTCADAYWHRMGVPLQPYHYCAGRFGRDSCVVNLTGDFSPKALV